MEKRQFQIYRVDFEGEGMTPENTVAAITISAPMIVFTGREIKLFKDGMNVISSLNLRDGFDAREVPL